MGISNLLKRFSVFILILYLVFGSTILVSADTALPKSEIPTRNQTEVSKYALSFFNNTKIPYVLGGGRGYANLEEVEKKGCGTDCSGFVMYVYKHFGINLPDYTETMYSVAKKRFTDESLAVPGDVVYWYWHVGIYVGDGKMIHTNTSGGPTPYPHLAGIYYRGTPTFLRMVDNVKDLKPIGFANLSESQGNDIKSSKEFFSEWSLKGLDGYEPTLQKDSSDITLASKDDLSDVEKNSLAIVSLGIQSKFSIGKLLSIAMKFMGMGLVLYGILLMVCFIFDYTNTFLEVSLLSIITFGKLRISYLGDEVGHIKEQGFTYVNFGMMVKKASLVFALGMFLISGSAIKDFILRVMEIIQHG